MDVQLVGITKINSIKDWEQLLYIFKVHLFLFDIKKKTMEFVSSNSFGFAGTLSREYRELPCIPSPDSIYPLIHTLH